MSNVKALAKATLRASTGQPFGIIKKLSKGEEIDDEEFGTLVLLEKRLQLLMDEVSKA